MDGAELIAPQSDDAATFQLARNQAHHVRPFTGRGNEFKVRRPHLAERDQHLDQPMQPFHHRVVEAIDQPILEGNPQQFLERLLRPFRLGY